MLTETTPGLGTASGTINIGSDNHGILTFGIPNVGTYTLSVVLNSSNPATEFHSVQIDDIQPSPSGQHAEASCYRDITTAFTSGNVKLEPERGVYRLLALRAVRHDNNACDGDEIQFGSVAGQGERAVEQQYDRKPSVGGSATLSDQAAGGQTFTVSLASNGRASFTPDPSLDCKDSGGNAVACPVFLYFYDNNSAFIMSTGDGIGTGFIEAQSSTATPSGSYIEYGLPNLNPDAADEIGLFTLTTGSTNTFDGTTDRGGEGTFRWAQPLNPDGPAPTYGSTDSNGVVAVNTGDTPVDCVTITSSKLGCISQDDQPNVHLLLK